MTTLHSVRGPIPSPSPQAAPTPKPSASEHAPHATGTTRSNTTRNLALGGIGAASLIGGGVIGALRGSPLAGLGIGAAIGAVAIGAALLGSASSSQRDGYCDSYGDPDCDYPGVGYDPGYNPGYDPGYGYDNPYWDGGYRDSDGDGAREDYPDTGYYPGGGTSWGDE